MQKTGVFLFINHSCLIVLIMEIIGCHTAWEQDQSLCTVNCTCHSTDTDARSDKIILSMNRSVKTKLGLVCTLRLMQKNCAYQ